MMFPARHAELPQVVVRVAIGPTLPVGHRHRSEYSMTGFEGRAIGDGKGVQRSNDGRLVCFE